MFLSCRIAIARALVRKPRLLILDEATSALDNESSAIVQEAIDNLMESPEHTVIVIAHRLSTIRCADRIAMIADGKVVDLGSHEELMNKPNGRYKRLFESSRLNSTVASVGLPSISSTKIDEEDKEESESEDDMNEEEVHSFTVARARQMARPDVKYLLVGAVGAAIVGAVYPCWGINLR
jgi:ATP-binding cassette, subfamily B (MDR/TAP), member 1